MNVERRVSFGMERAKTDILLTRSPQMTVLASDTEKIAALFYAFCVQVDGHAPVWKVRHERLAFTCSLRRDRRRDNRSGMSSE